jgi:hypothetical protein
MVVGAGCAGISEGGEVSEAYKTSGANHAYMGKLDGRGHRQRSKIFKALKGIATLGLIDEVMREDRLKRHVTDEERKRLGGAFACE